MRTFISLAICRSGQHGIINWICSQFPGRIIHHNNAVLGWKQKKPRSKYGYKRWYRNEGEDDGMFFSIESQEPKDLIDIGIYDFPEIANDTITIIILRDPLNWLASDFRKKKADGLLTSHMHEFQGEKVTDLGMTKSGGLCQIYKALIDEGMGRTDLLPSPKITIFYHLWMHDRSYRKRLAEHLRINSGDKGKEGILHFGGGSSFDGQKYDGEAYKMDTMNRYKRYVADSKYMKIVTSEGLISISKNVFGIKLDGV